MLVQAPQNISYDRLQQELIRVFGAPDMDFALRAQINNLRDAFPSSSAVRDLAVLDIGCGCAHGSAEVDCNRGTWAPWLCRAVAILGGKATGVDVGRCSPDDQGRFHYCRINLCSPGALTGFADASFDAVNCTNLFSSPHLVYRCEMAEREQRIELMNSIEREIGRLLKPGGKVISFDRDVDSF